MSETDKALLKTGGSFLSYSYGIRCPNLPVTSARQYRYDQQAHRVWTYIAENHIT